MTGPVTVEQDFNPTPVRELMRLMSKCQRAIMLHLPNNPTYQEAETNLRTALAEYWREAGELLLRVQDNGLSWHGHDVLEEPNRDDSMGWILFKDGIIAVKILPGAEDEEVMRFLRAIHKARTLPEDAEDDARTLLWAEDFHTIKLDYAVIGVGMEGTRRLERSECFAVSATPLAVQREMALDIEGVEGIAKDIVGMDDFDSSLYFLDADEIQYLGSEIEREYSQDMRRNVLSMLFDAIELDENDAERAEIVTVLDEFFRYLLGAGDFWAVAYIIREARTLADRFGAEHRMRLATFASDLSEPDTLNNVLQTLTDCEDTPSEEDLREIFGQLQPHSIETALAWLPRVTHEHTKRILDRATEQLAAAHPEAVNEALASEDRTVLVGALVLMHRLNIKTADSELEKLTSHVDIDVRQALVDALATVGTSGALRQLEQLLQDTERGVRIRAVERLSTQRHNGALSHIEAAVLGKGIRLADLTEKRAFFQAYGRLSGNTAVAQLRKLLVTGPFRRRVDAATRACAAMALGEIGSPEARETLKKFENDKEPLVRVAVHEALTGATS